MPETSNQASSVPPSQPSIPPPPVPPESPVAVTAPTSPQIPVSAPPSAPKPPTSLAPQHIKPKLGRNVLTCWTYASVLVLLVLSTGLYLLARTGLFKIPLFSRAYSGPLPTRLVNPPPMTQEDFAALLGSRFKAESQKKASPPYRIRLTERELTGALANGIDSALGDESWKHVFTQVVVEPTELELVGQFQRGWARLDVFIRFVPHVVQGGVSFEPVFVQIGDYKLPPRLAYQMLGYLFARDLNAWILEFGGMQVLDVHLSRGYMELRVAPTGIRP